MNNKKIGFIGAGKVGVTLGAYFQSKGLNVIGYKSMNLQSAKTAARITKSNFFYSVKELAENSDMIYITTPDDQIIKVWNELNILNLKNKIICHTSGSLSSEVFNEAEHNGIFTYSIHPMYAFSNKNGQFGGIENAYFTIEGNKEHLLEIIGFISKLGNKTLVIDSDKKVLYHIANVLVSNLVLALLNMGDFCIKQCGIDSENSIESLMPLILANINNISENGFINSLTGPIERNDTGTIQKHLDAIPQEYGNIYANLSIILTQLAIEKHSDRDYTMLLDQLNKYIKNKSDKEILN